MSPIRVAVVQVCTDMLTAFIADAIRESQDFELVSDQVLPIALIEDRGGIDDGAIDALIVVGDLDASPIDLFKARHARVVIAHIAIGSDVVRFDLPHLGLEQLLAALRDVTRRGARSERSLEYELVPAARGEPLRAGRLVPVGSIRSPLIEAALAWIDAAVRDYHRRHPPGAGDVPGLARAPSSLEGLLGEDADDEVRRESAVALEAAEAALFTELLSPASGGEPLALCYRRLGLTRAEVMVLLLCLAPELDARFQPVFGILNDDMSRRGPTLGLACAIAGDPLAVRGQIACSGNLTRWRLLEAGDSLPRADDLLRLDASLIAWLAGDHAALLADSALGGCLAAEPWRGGDLLRRPSDMKMHMRLVEAFSRGPDTEWLVLSGKDAGGWRAQVEHAAQELGTQLLRVSLAGLARLSPTELAAGGARLARAARVMGMVLVFDGSDPGDRAEAAAALERMTAILGRLGQSAVLIAPEVHQFAQVLRHHGASHFERDRPEASALATAYMAAAADAGLSLTPDQGERLGLAFPLSLDTIEDAVRLTAIASAPPAEHYERLSAVCRRLASPDLPRFAHRVTPVYSLDDVVLPADSHDQLTELVGHVEHAPKVMTGWGFGAHTPYGRGVAALFSGASGTGKTMAAQAVANRLKTEVCIVDVSRVVSKYIGESEKNLDVVFGDAERASAVLVFDEADAIFGKRSEVKDAHDRYANIEVAYLLQRMETFSGLIILTTNFRQNLDQAFLRRLRFVVEFPKPDAAARAAIWRQCLPATAPVSSELRLEIDSLARRIELTGGNIKQITLRAAFAAAGETTAETPPSIETRHVLAAARAELIKLGRGTAVRELDEYEAFRLKSARQAA